MAPAPGSARFDPKAAEGMAVVGPATRISGRVVDQAGRPRADYRGPGPSSLRRPESSRLRVGSPGSVRTDATGPLYGRRDRRGHPRRCFDPGGEPVFRLIPGAGDSPSRARTPSSCPTWRSRASRPSRRSPPQRSGGTADQVDRDDPTRDRGFDPIGWAGRGGLTLVDHGDEPESRIRRGRSGCFGRGHHPVQGRGAAEWVGQGYRGRRDEGSSGRPRRGRSAMTSRGSNSSARR